MAAVRLGSARSPDRFEAEPHAFFERVAQGYAARMSEQPLRFARVDADQPPEHVWQAVRAAVVERAWLPAQSA